MHQLCRVSRGEIWDKNMRFENFLGFVQNQPDCPHRIQQGLVENL